MSSLEKIAADNKVVDVLNISKSEPEADDGHINEQNPDRTGVTIGTERSLDTSPSAPIADDGGKSSKSQDKQVVTDDQVDDMGDVEVLQSPSSGRQLDEPVESAASDPMESSISTLKLAPNPSTDPQKLLSPADGVYLDPTPKTPVPSQPPSRSTSNAASIPLYSHKREPSSGRSPTRSDAGFDDRVSGSDDDREGVSRTEIQTIMDQFSEEGVGPDHEEVMSPRLEIAGPLLGSPLQHPPRKSSLEPLKPSTTSAVQSLQDLRLTPTISSSSQSRIQSEAGPPVPPKSGSIRSFSISTPRKGDDYSTDNPMSPPLHRPPPPEPEPEPDLPFDFHRFLEQLRHRTADPVAKFLRSFLQEFGKKQWMVHEQVKIISDFLAFITNKMGQCEVWREVSDAEFDNAREGMEKLVMNRLYTQTFSPAIPPPQPIPGSRPKRKGAERPMGPGRRGQHQEDVERDDILAQKVSIYGWVKETHLDITPVGEGGKKFLILAQQGEHYLIDRPALCNLLSHDRTRKDQNV